jgi:hypothetical protein
MAHQDSGASSHVWIRQQIKSHFYSASPVSAILEVTTRMIEDPENKIPVNQKNSERKEILSRISTELHNRSYVINGNNVTMTFIERDQYKVHHITREGHLDVVKAIFMKMYVDDINARLPMFYPNYQYVGINFLLSRPLDYMPGYAVVDGRLVPPEDDEVAGSEEEL